MDGLANLTPGQQLRAPRLGHRIAQLMVGLVLYGVSLAMLLRSSLGLDPWDVFHQGLTRWVPLSFGTVVILVGVLVLLLWLPLRQLPGLGTVANTVVVGLACDVALAVLAAPASLEGRIALFGTGLVLNALATALYIGAQLGPGPRDGLMTGLVRRTGWSVRVVRTSIEVAVLAVGFALGGTVGVGTVLYAVGIGPLVQLFLPTFIVPLQGRRATDPYGDWLVQQHLRPRPLPARRHTRRGLRRSVGMTSRPGHPRDVIPAGVSGARSV